MSTLLESFVPTTEDVADMDLAADKEAARRVPGLTDLLADCERTLTWIEMHCEYDPRKIDCYLLARRLEIFRQELGMSAS